MMQQTLKLTCSSSPIRISVLLHQCLPHQQQQQQLLLLQQVLQRYLQGWCPQHVNACSITISSSVLGRCSVTW
jgi:hypothetical protein